MPRHSDSGELTAKEIWASDCHPVDSAAGHLGYGYWATTQFDGDGVEPAGVRYILGAAYDRVKVERDELLAVVEQAARVVETDQFKAHIMAGPIRGMQWKGETLPDFRAAVVKFGETSDQEKVSDG